MHFEFKRVIVVLVIYLLLLITVCDSVPPADAAAAVLVDNSIWMFGGSNNSKTCGNTLYSLDLSQPWSITSPNWTDHSGDIQASNTTNVYGRCRTTIALGMDGLTLLAYGGEVNNWDNYFFESPFASYNLCSQMWTDVKVYGPPPLLLARHRATRNADGLIFYSGGYSYQNVTVSDTDTSVYLTGNAAIVTLNTTSGEYRVLPQSLGLFNRHFHTATIIKYVLYRFSRKFTCIFQLFITLSLKKQNVYPWRCSALGHQGRFSRR